MTSADLERMIAAVRGADAAPEGVAACLARLALLLAADVEDAAPVEALARAAAQGGGNA
jgi:hypothetical protein